MRVGAPRKKPRNDIESTAWDYGLAESLQDALCGFAASALHAIFDLCSAASRCRERAAANCSDGALIDMPLSEDLAGARFINDEAHIKLGVVLVTYTSRLVILSV